jgi:cytochrome c biogenesis protein CcdA
MTLFILAYLGGALTILAPCILPVVPFVFARVDQPFHKSGLPLLAGMALTFAVVGTLGAVAGDWAVAANDYGRMAAIAALAAMGLALLAPRWTERLTRPLVTLGSRLLNIANGHRRPWHAPDRQLLSDRRRHRPSVGTVCRADPRLILTGAALQGPSVQTSLLLLAYGAGAVTSLAVALRSVAASSR